MGWFAVRFAGSICTCAVLASLSGLALGSETSHNRRASQVPMAEVDFDLCREIPVGLVAGTPDHPRLVEVQWLRIEPKELPGGVAAHVGWSGAAEATWRIGVDLLDDRGAFCATQAAKR